MSFSSLLVHNDKTVLHLIVCQNVTNSFGSQRQAAAMCVFTAGGMFFKGKKKKGSWLNKLLDVDRQHLLKHLLIIFMVPCLL